MREIKFRAWDKWVKRMSEPFKVGEHIPLGIRVDSNDYIMQCTGLKDKNGKEIYEGDIVTKRHRPDLHCLVYFDDRDFSYRLAIRGDKQFDKTLPLMFADEIIGCVYENPEFLKEGK